MELSFIWIEDFRNIRTQGINLSSKYLFQYDSIKHELTVHRNERYIKDFFGANISNISGIVGQNGAGKTNVLELIQYIAEDGNTILKSPFFVIYEDKDDLVGHYNGFKQGPLTDRVEFSTYPKDNEFMSPIFFSNAFDGRRHNFSKKVVDVSTNQFLNTQFGSNFLVSIKKDLQDQLKFITSNSFKELERVETSVHPDDDDNKLYPTHVALISPTWGSIFARADSFDRKVSETFGTKTRVLRSFCQSFRKKITDNKSGRAILYYTSFLLFLDFIVNEFTESQFKKKKPKGLGKQPPKEVSIIDDKASLESSLRDFNLDKLSDERIDVIHSYITKEISTIIDRDFPYSDEKARFLFELGEFEFQNIEKTNEGSYSNRRIDFKAPFSKEMISFLRRYLTASSNINLTYNIEWLGISSGHKAYLGLFSRFFSVVQKIKKDSVLICIDEGDLYFHPQWQVEFLYKLVEILPRLFKNKQIQLIITTHSPFLVSDLPKHHLIFLKKEQGFSKVVPIEEIQGETFGGNIGELYLDVFFLNGSLMSHFAQHKIRDLINRIKKNRTLEANDARLLGQIGEQVIKVQIENLVDDINR